MVRSLAGLARMRLRGDGVRGGFVFDPWFLTAAGFVLGIVVGDQAQREAAIPGAFAALASAVLLALARARDRVEPALRIALVLASIGAGALRMAVVPRAVTGVEAGLLVVVEGTLARAPLPPRSPQVDDTPPPHRASLRRLQLMDAQLDAGLGPRAIDGIVHMLMETPPAGLRANARVRVTGIVRSIGGPRNPGQRDARADLRRAGVALVIEVDDPRALTIVRAPAPWSPTAVLESVRERFVAHLDAVLSPRAAGLAAALLVDVRDGLDESDEDALLATGLIHLIAISGFHIVLLVGAARVALSMLFAPRTTDVAAIAFALLYAGLAGAGAPVVRSALGFAIARVCALASRSTPPLAPLALAAIVLACAHPADVFHPGFQLSFAAVLGLVTMPRSRDRGRGGRARPGDVVRMALRTSVRASLWTLPFLVFHFGRIAPWSPLLTVLLTPWFVVAFGLTALELPQFVLCGGWWPIHRACGWMLERFADLVVLAAELPGSILEWPRAGVATFVCGMAALCAWMERRILLAWVLAASAAACAHHTAPRVAGFDAWLFDVGHGQALLLRGEHGPCVLIDAGALGRDDCGERVLLPALDAIEAPPIDALILTHGDADHVNGAVALLRAGRVRRVIHGPSFARTRTARAVLDTARALGIPVERAGAGTRIVDGPSLRIDAIAPLDDDPQRSSNDSSLVVRVDAPGVSMLVAGDLETAGIDALLASPVLARADVLILPHHGQREPRLGLLLERVAPRLALASRRGPWPRGEGPRLAGRIGASLWSTAEHGAIHFDVRTQTTPQSQLTRHRWRVEGWSSGEILALELPPQD